MPLPSGKEYAAALKDFREGVASLHVWPMLGWIEIKHRYRRSIIGPFWLTLSYGALIAGIGPLYGRLLQQDVASYLPYLTTGFIGWFLISGLLNESCSAFVNAESLIKQLKLPLTIHVLRVVWRNLIIFAHNLVIVVIVFFLYQPAIDWHVLLLPLGVLAIAVNGVWFGLLFGLLCARFRDIPLVVASVVQLAFFLTPVMWRPEMLHGHRWAADWNPLFHFLEVVRGPVLGHDVALHSWAVVLGVTIVGYVVALFMFSRYRYRIAYWV